MEEEEGERFVSMSYLLISSPFVPFLSPQSPLPSPLLSVRFNLIPVNFLPFPFFFCTDFLYILFILSLPSSSLMVFSCFSLRLLISLALSFPLTLLLFFLCFSPQHFLSAVYSLLRFSLFPFHLVLPFSFPNFSLQFPSISPLPCSLLIFCLQKKSSCFPYPPFSHVSSTWSIMFISFPSSFFFFLFLQDSLSLTFLPLPSLYPPFILSIFAGLLVHFTPHTTPVCLLFLFFLDPHPSVSSFLSLTFVFSLTSLT